MSLGCVSKFKLLLGLAVSQACCRLLSTSPGSLSHCLTTTPAQTFLLTPRLALPWHSSVPFLHLAIAHQGAEACTSLCSSPPREGSQSPQLLLTGPSSPLTTYQLCCPSLYAFKDLNILLYCGAQTCTQYSK